MLTVELHQPCVSPACSISSRWPACCRTVRHWSMLPKQPVQMSQPSLTSAALSTPFSTCLRAAPTSVKLASASWASSSRPLTLKAGAQVGAAASPALQRMRIPCCTLCRSNWGGLSKARTRRGWTVWQAKRKANRSSRLWPVLIS